MWQRSNEKSVFGATGKAGPQTQRLRTIGIEPENKVKAFSNKKYGKGRWKMVLQRQSSGSKLC